MPGGLYYGSFAFIMNSDFLAGLSETDRNAVMSVSGEKLAKLAGQQWDAADVAGLAAAKKAGTTITTASAEMHKKYLTIMAPIEAQWIERANNIGIDGKAALEELRAIARGY